MIVMIRSLDLLFCVIFGQNAAEVNQEYEYKLSSTAGLDEDMANAAQENCSDMMYHTTQNP